MRLFMPLVLAPSLAGCAIKNHQYGDTVAGRVVADLPQEHSRVVIARPGVMGFAIPFGLHVNGQKVEHIGVKRRFELDLPTGPVQVEAKGEKPCTITFNAAPAREYAVKVKVRMGWWWARAQLEVEDPEAIDGYRESCQLAQPLPDVDLLQSTRGQPAGASVVVGPE